ncbi:MAG: LysR family transcriptional regulator [Prosthecobacter sp.]
MNAKLNDPHLNYHHLRLFWEVARAGSLRAAASRLHLSQPTISAQIKALEKSLDEQLFDRTGRGLKLTPQGRLVMECAGEIFSLGTEMVRSLHGQGSARSLRLNIGITDSLPKLVAWRLIRPAVKAFPNLQLSCMEGHAQELLGSLAAGRLDVVLSDEAAPSSMPVKAFNHLLGESPVVFCAVPTLAKKLSTNFPASLKNAPMLLPASRTAWRHEIDRWFDSHHIRPHIVAEFDDAALMKTAAADGLGVAPIATAVLDEAVDRYGLKPVGRPVRCGFSCYLITLERAMRHPALAVIAGESKSVFSAAKSKR